MKYLLIDLIFTNNTKFPNPSNADIPISGVRYQVIDNNVSKEMTYITFIDISNSHNGVDCIESVENESELIKRVCSVIKGESVCSGSFIIDWTGFDYRYLISRSLILNKEIPDSSGHLAIGLIYKHKYPNNSMCIRDIYYKASCIAPVDDFGVFKFNMMKLLLNQYYDFVDITKSRLTNG